MPLERRGARRERPDAVPDGDGRRGAGGQHQGHRGRPDQARPARCWPTSTSARSRSGTTRRITKLNPGVKLPDQAITVVHRSDGSGTTFIFTNYLSKVSPEWKEKVGEDTSVAVADRRGRQGQRGRRRLRAAHQRRHRLRRVRLRPAEQDGLRPAEEPAPASSWRRQRDASRPPPPAPTGRRPRASTWC